MLSIVRNVASMCVLTGFASFALSQSYSDTQRQYQEQQRQHQERQREEQRLRENERDHDDLMRVYERDRVRNAPQAHTTQLSPGTSNQLSFSTVATGVAGIAATAFVLDAIFGPGKKQSSSTVTPRGQGHQLGQPGKPKRFDTFDGKVAKVCLLPPPQGGIQTVVYRWDAPNEMARTAEVAPSATHELFQFTHPSAERLFIYVSKPEPDHQPSDVVYGLQAHRIADTGCKMDELFRIEYPKYGGPARLARW